MPDETIMDANNPRAKSRFEFTLPLAEIDTNLNLGEVGSISIPVEVMEVLRDFVTFRKRGRATTQMEFQEPTLKDMEDELGIGDR